MACRVDPIQRGTYTPITDRVDGQAMKEDANTREEMKNQRAHVGRAGKERSKGI